MRRRRALLVLLLGILPTLWVASQVDPGHAHNCSFTIVRLQGTTTTLGNPDCTPSVQEPTHTCTSTTTDVVAESLCLHD